MLEVFRALWFIIPAYVANGSASLVGGGKAIDGGRKFVDGQPLFGSGKTWRGFWLAVVIGTLLGTLQALLPEIRLFPKMTVSLAFLLALGAMTGDLAGSFLKRRLKIEKGKPAPLLDQLDFLCGALLFAWFTYPVNLSLTIILLVLTPPIHLFASVVGYLLKVKETLW